MFHKWFSTIYLPCLLGIVNFESRAQRRTELHRVNHSVWAPREIRLVETCDGSMISIIEGIGFYAAVGCAYEGSS